MTVLLTGAAGFIGYHVAEALLARGERVIGLDNLNAYYDVRLKQARLARLQGRAGFAFHRIDLADRAAMAGLAAAHPQISRIVHLAAQAGVRHSLQDPYAYVASNVLGHLAVLELARHLGRLDHLVYASSSSVYGANQALPFSEADRVDTPLSLYAATKRADELMGYAYGHLFGLRQTGLRFFTVYGPWGRPDMAYWLFARAILAGEHGVRRRHAAAGFHLHRRHRRWRGRCAGSSAGAGCRAADAAAEHRQPPQRIGGDADRTARIGTRPPCRDPRSAAAACRRRGDVCRHRGHLGIDRLHPGDAACGRNSAVCRLVYRLDAGRRRRRGGRLTWDCKLGG